MGEKKIHELLDEVASEICDNYCKWPNKCKSIYKDVDEAEEELEKICCDCPLVNRL